MVVEARDHPIPRFGSRPFAIGHIVESLCGPCQFGGQIRYSPSGIAGQFGGGSTRDWIEDGAFLQLTRDGSETIINGTSDWVYEEEFFLRDAFRWSPDGKRIAYWQFNTSGVRKFGLVYNVGAPYDVLTHIPYPQYGLYPQIKEIAYPEPGTPNSLICG